MGTHFSYHCSHSGLLLSQVVPKNLQNNPEAGRSHSHHQKTPLTLDQTLTRSIHQITPTTLGRILTHSSHKSQTPCQTYQTHSQMTSLSHSHSQKTCQSQILTGQIQ